MISLQLDFALAVLLPLTTLDYLPMVATYSTVQCTVTVPLTLIRLYVVDDSDAADGRWRWPMADAIFSLSPKRQWEERSKRTISNQQMRANLLRLLLWWYGTACFQSGGFITLAFCLDVPSSLQSNPTTTPTRTRTFASATATEQELFSPEVQVALQAVRKACAITQKLQENISDIVTLTKTDASPVTVADFASQAVVLQHLKEHFPNDLFLAEESSSALLSPVTQKILDACLGLIPDENNLKDNIDLGQTFFQATTRPISRVWCLDPIDGTKGFLRKGQYCVALSLLQDGIPTIGVLACPNLPLEGANSESGVGCIFVAVKGKGCFQLSMEDTPSNFPPRRLEKFNSVREASRARFCVGVEQGFSDPVGKCKDMAKLLHGRLADDGEILYSTRMDSQAKYGAVARGDAEFYVRLPKEDFCDWIWDVAPGVLVLEEVGGKVTDASGNPLDFSKGARLTSNGILGAINAELHQKLLEAYRN